MKIKIISLLILISIAALTSGCIKNKQEIMPQTEINNKVLLIVAYQGFQDLEYGETRQALEEAGCAVTIASSQPGIARGKLGGEVEVELTLNEVRVDDFQAVVFIGGPGADEYMDNPLAHKIARQAVEKNKVLAAICIAPAILAQAGLLEGKKATVWSSLQDQSFIQQLKDGGAEYQKQDMVVDGKLVTANGPAAAADFGRAIAQLLAQQ